MSKKPIWRRIKEFLKGEVVKDTGEPFFMNGEGAVHLLLKDGTLLSIMITDCPDEEVIKEVFQ